MQSFGDKMITRTFKVSKKLSLNNKRVVKLLEQAVLLTSKVYEDQMKRGFYPKGVSKEKLQAASKNTPEILSPYFIVTGKENNFKAIPYHEAYEDLLTPISEKLQQAGNICTNATLKKYILTRAKALRDGTYEEADKAWFLVRNTDIDFYIGPFEPYQDKIFFKKRAYQGFVGFIDKIESQEVDKLKNALYSSAKMSSEKNHSTDIPKKGVHIFVEDILITSGYLSEVLFSAEFYPLEVDFLKEHGSRVVFYKSQLEYKFEKLLYPIFQSIFEKRFASRYSKELLFKAAFYNICLYEFSLQLHQYGSGKNRLNDLYGIIDEANGFVSGIQHGKDLVIKGLIDEVLLEAIIIIHILWILADWMMYKYTKGKESHIIGNSMIIDDYFAKGALNVHNGISWPNFYRIFFEIEDMADDLVYLLKEGSYKQAEEFIKKNTALESFKKLEGNLKTINANI
ncbi:hypothetical protein A2769_01710 [Candidatus Daviesbacteria bacterium RIFCSPHIGHO2_01_FULL_37_27]|nr:MAG: hypothetical protein A2769_01710 [Candidatus Daviesbacteria bacterium RIFCSPHIGHO2_01_FULL_37_27]OGE44945.1 MAG: hypothetical protein A3B39_02505 [Candidatus Daviesbacteria bacterium RIFCSPLOWO2_01_FULL_37_10]